MAATKASAAGDGRLAARIGAALRKALQDVLLPELREHGESLHRHEQSLNSIVDVLREHSSILHQHGERLAHMEGYMQTVDGRLARIEARLDQALEMRDRLAAVEGCLTALEARSA
jgi:chromosome segregation ATPase